MSDVQKLPVHHLQQQGVSQFSGFFDLHGQWALSTNENDSLNEGVLIIWLYRSYQTYFLFCTIGWRYYNVPYAGIDTKHNRNP